MNFSNGKYHAADYVSGVRVVYDEFGKQLLGMTIASGAVWKVVGDKDPPQDAVNFALETAQGMHAIPETPFQLRSQP